MPRWRYVFGFVLFVALSVMWVRDQATAHNVASLSENLLVNGNFDELPFYGSISPNHYIAGGWYRWWIEGEGTEIPEFDDVDKPDGGRRDIHVDGTHAQVYHKYGPSYTAGIYQVVEGLTPCRPYELTMYARNHSLPGVQPHARIGLDPFGAHLNTGEDLDERGAVFDTAPLDRAVWSREQTSLFVWEQLSVTAEPRGDKLTVILFASPEPGSDADHYYDTFWDAGALRPTTYEDDRLPTPAQPTSGFIHDVTWVSNTDSLTISWKLTTPAITQISYGVSTPSVITPTIPLTHTAYLPLISGPPPKYTPVDFDNGVSRVMTIPDLRPGQIVSWTILARRLDGDTCVTEYAGPFEAKLASAAHSETQH
ncbi:MAG: hypothetical protein ACP5HG_08340 [Anaerolineae bacterium]